VQSSVPRQAETHVLARPEQDIVESLERLADALGCPNVAPPNNGERPSAAGGALTPEGVAATLAALMPENAIIADESVSFGRGFFANTRAAAPHDWLNVTGGSIGGGMPMATGAALGAPGRRVINLQADGSALYTVQALWTQAREKLDVVTVIFSNRKYQILLGELALVGANPGRTALDMMDIGNPDIDWPRLAGSFGVEAARTASAEGFADLLGHALRRTGPFLIELLI
jgi:acetolactate synthase-1/2/3 large subunit